ncbi:TetR family transcriptional regulator [Demequina sp. SYSU T00192]|uniref:TetR family transcriptional regulator n=1 Tax=Demequina litoralis TaxID=3051660 RepID=A0ABT8G8F7_9MICO|nr:TetR family transcriptional regulator [Demequina sp. SYSU T00192]MDN4475224.1 TetR family transcriptional regulator [Demequina sp. SYSU T00192]
MSAAGRSRSRGPRGGDADTRGDILAAAAEVFGDEGYGAASMREIARRADVDPALIRHYFPSKRDLFVHAVRPVTADDPRVTALAGTPRDRLGEALLRLFLGVWDDPEMGKRLRAVLASIAAAGDLGQALADVMLRDILSRLVREDDAPLRAEACGSQLVGLAMARYVIGMPAVAHASADELVALYAPTLQRYIDGDIEAA